VTTFLRITGQKALQADVIAIKDVQQKQGIRLETLETGQQAKARQHILGLRRMA
jgi:hypothetical protein